MRLLPAARRHSPASQVLLAPLFRVVQWVRIALLLHALAVAVVRLPDTAHRGVVAALLLVMAAMTGASTYAYSRRSGRALWFAAADVTVAAVLTGVSPWALGPAYLPSAIPVTGFWAVCAPLAVAMGHSAWLGAVAGAVIGLTQVLAYPSWEPGAWSAVVVYSLVSVGFGLVVDFLLDSLGERDRAFAATAALAERERLNRIVHDGVLQVLALMEREGPGLGPRGARLAALAKEQESQLRSMLQDRRVNVDPDPKRRDLIAVLDRHASSTVTISTMADEMVLPDELVREVDAIVSEILTNVTKHAGPGAQAWLLLEREGREMIVSIRDNGVGATKEQLSGAGADGHVGVKNSILGRIRDLGGQAVVRAAPGRGVEWELRVPTE